MGPAPLGRMSIVCGSDLSRASEEAAVTAAKLAKRLGEELVLCHVIEPWAAYAVEHPAIYTSILQQRIEEARAALARQAGELRQLGVAVTERLLEDVPERALAGLAADLHARALVVGGHGHRGLGRFILGSVAERLTRRAPCPVLVTFDHTSRLASRLDGDQPLELFVALDSSAASRAPLAWVKQLRTSIDCDLTFAHYYWPPLEYARLGLHGRTFEGTDPEVVRVLTRDLQELVGELPGSGAVRFRVEPSWGRLGEVIAKGGAAADLIVVGAHQRHGAERLAFESVSREVLRASHTPVVCVPAHAVPRETAVPALRRVLAATDFSAQGNQAVAFAFALFGTDPGFVDLVHVLEDRLPADTASELTVPPKERQEVETRLQALVPPAIEGHILARPHVILGGSAGEAIAQEGERLGADVICIGAHGRGQLKHMLMGATAKQLLKHPRRPVLIVPEEE